MKPPFVTISAAAMAELEEYNVGTNQRFLGDRMVGTTMTPQDLCGLVFAFSQDVLDELSAPFLLPDVTVVAFETKERAYERVVFTVTEPPQNLDLHDPS